MVTAKDVSAIGYGSTPEEATEDATLNIFYQVFNATISSYTTLSTTSENNNVLSNSYSNKTISEVDGKLVGIEYSPAEKTSKAERESGKYKVTATITDGMSAGYSKLQKDAVNNINILFPMKKELEEKAPTDFAIRKNNLYSLSNALRDYQIYSNALVALGHSELITDHNHTDAITYESSRTELESLLTEEQNMLSKELNDTTNELTKQNVKNLLSTVRQELDAMQKEKEDLIKAQEETNNQRIQNKVNATAVNMKHIDTSISSGANSLKDRINYIDDNILSYELNLYNMVSMLTTESNNTITQKNIAINEIRYKGYKSAEMSEGEPTPLALNVRQKEIDELESEKQKELNTLAEAAWEKLGKTIQDSFTQCINILDDTKGREYHVNLSSKEISVSKLSYDGKRGEWIIGLEYYGYNIGSYVLPYEIVTGESPITNKSDVKDNTAYNDYISIQEEIHNRMVFNFSDIGDILVKIKVVDVKSDRLVLSIENCSYNSNSFNTNTKLSPSGKKEKITYIFENILTDHGFSWISNNSDELPRNLLPSLGIDINTKQKTLLQEDKDIKSSNIKKSFSPNSMLDWVIAPKLNISIGSTNYDNNSCIDISLNFGVDIGKFFPNHFYLGITPTVNIRTFGDIERAVTRFGLLGDIGYQYSRFMIGIRGGYGVKLYNIQAYLKFTLLPNLNTDELFIFFDPTIELGIELENNPLSTRFYTGVSLIF